MTENKGKLCVIWDWSGFRITLKSSFTTCLRFVSSANVRADKNRNTLVGFSQTVRLSSYKVLTNFVNSVQNLVRPINQNQNVTSNEHVP